MKARFATLVLLTAALSQVRAQTNTPEAEYEAKLKKHEAYTKAKQHFDDAVALENDKNLEGAIEEFKTAATADPTVAVIYGRLALAQFNLGVATLNDAIRNKDGDRRVKAKDYFTQSAASAQQAIALEPTNTVYTTTLARALATLGVRFGDADAAERASRQYQVLADAESDPQKKAALLLKSAETLFDSGLTNKSIAQFFAVLQADVGNLAAVHKLALALVADGDASGTNKALQLELAVVQQAPEGSRMKQEAEFMLRKLSGAPTTNVPPALAPSSAAP